MCLAVSGKIKNIKPNNLAEVDFDGVLMDVNIELVDASVGDNVMVHAGFAIQKVTIEDIKKLKEYY